MSNLFPRMRASSLSAWRNRTSTKSQASLLLLPFGRKIPRAIRARQSLRRRRSTTTCGFFSRVAGKLSASSAARKSAATAPRKSPRGFLSFAPGRRFYVMYPLRIPQAPAATGGARRVPKKKTAAPPQELLKQALGDIQKRGFNRLYQDGRVHEFSSPETLLDVDFSKPVYVLVDRLSVNPESRSRLTDSVEICYREGGGRSHSRIHRRLGGQSRRTPYVQRAVRMQKRRHAISGARAPAFFFQQSLRRVPALPGIRQHD